MRIDGNGGDPQFCRTAEDPNCDFRTVGDKQFVDGGHDLLAIPAKNRERSR